MLTGADKALDAWPDVTVGAQTSTRWPTDGVRSGTRPYRADALFAEVGWWGNDCFLYRKIASDDKLSTKTLFQLHKIIPNGK